MLREGGKHTIWHNPALDVRVPVPRHREIQIGTARAICRQLSIPPPWAALTITSRDCRMCECAGMSLEGVTLRLAEMRLP